MKPRHLFQALVLCLCLTLCAGCGGFKLWHVEVEQGKGVVFVVIFFKGEVMGVVEIPGGMRKTGE